MIGQVALLDLHGFNPEVEDTRSGVLSAEMVYSFLIGYTLRLPLPHMQFSQSVGRTATLSVTQQSLPTKTAHSTSSLDIDAPSLFDSFR